MLKGIDHPSMERRLYRYCASDDTFGGAAKANESESLLFAASVRSLMRPENMIDIAAVLLYICCCTLGWSNVVTCGSM